MGKKGLIKIDFINITDASINMNNGNIAGTVCYIRNIGKYFPWFHKANENISYLRDYNLESNPNDWLTKLRVCKFDNKINQWVGGGTYHFYKEKPNKKIHNKESVLKNPIKLNKSKKSRKLKKSKKHIRKIKLKSK